MRTRRVVTLALLLALEVILSRFLSISTPVVKIGFSFIPIALVAMLYGPLWAGCTAALADFLGAVLFPIGPYFPGFTLTAFCTGLLFGLFLYKKEARWPRVLLCTVLIAVVLTLGLDLLWMTILYEKAASAFVAARLLKCGVMIPLQTVVITILCRRIADWVRYERAMSPARRKTETDRP